MRGVAVAHRLVGASLGGLGCRLQCGFTRGYFVERSRRLRCAPWLRVCTSRSPGIAASVVIPTRNRSTYLDLVLASLEQQLLPRRCWEVVIVDNASQDDTPAVLDRRDRRGHGHAADGRLGRGGGGERREVGTRLSIYSRRRIGPLSRKEYDETPSGERVRPHHGRSEACAAKIRWSASAGRCGRVRLRGTSSGLRRRSPCLSRATRCDV